MKKKFRKIVNSILASSFTALAGGFDSNLQEVLSHNPQNIEINLEDRKKIQKSVPALILKPQTEQMLLAGHKSHSSHSSHRSGTTGPFRNIYTPAPSNSQKSLYPNNTYTPRYPVPQNRPNIKSTININIKAPSTPKNTSQNNTSQQIDQEYTLGMRTLSFGMSGNDVTELTTLLQKNGFISEISYEYTELVQIAVQNFQQEAQLENNGICDLATINKLKNWNNKPNQINKNTNEENISESNISQNEPTLERKILKVGDYGAEVNELIKLLIKKKKLSIIYKDRILFDKNVEQALKKLQKELGLPATGIYDNKTYDLLMKKETNQ